MHLGIEVENAVRTKTKTRGIFFSTGGELDMERDRDIPGEKGGVSGAVDLERPEVSTLRREVVGDIVDRLFVVICVISEDNSCTSASTIVCGAQRPIYVRIRLASVTKSVFCCKKTR